MPRDHSRTLTFRYVGALLAVAGLLGTGQLLIQHALDRQQGDARVVNIAGRQRMLSQRLCMLLLASDRASLGDLARVADEWATSEDMLQSGRSITDGNPAVIGALFAAISGHHHAMLAAARTAIGGGDRSRLAQEAIAHQDAFLAGMDRIVTEYEDGARERVVRLRRIELVLLVITLVVLMLEGAFVFRPAVRALRIHLAHRDVAERQLVQVSDREQRRIAQDLHDGVGQQLIGVSSLLRALQRSPESAQRERLVEIDRLLADAIDHTRNLARGLYSHTIEIDGLATALRELAAQTERIYDLDCRVQVDDAIAVPPLPVQIHLYSIAREAVANAVKHAHASAIDIALTAESATLVLVVRDDGVGIDTRSPGGMGLHMMEHRANMIAGSLRVTRGSARGTVVSCTLGT